MFCTATAAYSFICSMTSMFRRHRYVQAGAPSGKLPPKSTDGPPLILHHNGMKTPPKAVFIEQANRKNAVASCIPTLPFCMDDGDSSGRHASLEIIRRLRVIACLPPALSTVGHYPSPAALRASRCVGCGVPLNIPLFRLDRIVWGADS